MKGTCKYRISQKCPQNLQNMVTIRWVTFLTDKYEIGVTRVNKMIFFFTVDSIAMKLTVVHCTE